MILTLLILLIATHILIQISFHMLNLLKKILLRKQESEENFYVKQSLEISNQACLWLYSKFLSCDLFTITNFEDDFEANRDKRCVIVTARVHPGETQASFVMEHIMDFLVGNSPEAKILRDTFVFKIVPMLNPDGVLVGNYRCNLAGVDLNRQWIDPGKKLHPSIFHTKLVKFFSE